MEAIKVGIREFRADMAQYIASATPVAVTRHGQTVGYFIPTKSQGEAEMVALEKAGEAIDRMLAAHRVDVDELAAEFDAMRKKTRKPAGSKAA
jgi:antitoxin (DNA-binding transcriptional repressor) of toxin-antitoxin stability system